MEIVDGVVDFLLRERYLLSAFELLHELIENGMEDSEAVSKLSQFFADPAVFPSDQLLHVQNLQETDSKKIMEEKAAALERVAVLEYELRLAQEDVKTLQMKLEARSQDPSQVQSNSDQLPQAISSRTQDQIGLHERKDLNGAVKDYLVSAGYKLTAMTFCEEADDQVLDDSGRVPNALQKYYRAYHTSEHETVPSEEPSSAQCDELAEMRDIYEKEKDLLKGSLKNAEAEATRSATTVHELREALKQVSEELDASRAEIVSLKSLQERYQSLEADLDNEKVISTVETEDALKSRETVEQSEESHEHQELHGNPSDRESPEVSQPQVSVPEEPSSVKREEDPETIHILAEALPNIVPYVLINHREELLPLMICAIGRHPDGNVRDSLTHILFNLIKRPDENQRRIIMDACISLSTSIGDIRTENELLPQCWEQINHNYEERRLLVAQSCGELGGFVRSDMRSSLILSILEQLIEDPAPVVREAASTNLAKLLPLFPNTDKYTKVEKMMFHLLSDSSAQVVETTLKALVPAVVTWTRCLRYSMKQLVQALFGRMLTIVQRCPPVSGVETSSDSQLRILREREGWNVEVLLRMLIQLVPDLRYACVHSCPFPISESDQTLAFSPENLTQHLQSSTRWEYFDWLAMDFFPILLKLLSMISPKEEALRKIICQLLLRFNDCFGSHFHTMVLRPIFLTAVGDDSLLHFLGSNISNRIEGLKPQTETAQTLAFKCILPLLLVGVLGIPNALDFDLQGFIKNLILDSSLKHGSWSCVRTPELVEAIRFFCSYDRHHEVMTGVLWELVVNSNVSVKVHAALLLREMVPYASTQLVSKQLLPALVTLGSDTNLEVRHTTIPAYGIIAQHFQDEMVSEKIRVQMDAFLDDGSNEAISGVVRALTVAVPLASPVLRDYLLQKLVVLTASPMGTNVARRRERADVFCEAIRSLDATDLSPTSIRELLLPTIQNLLRDPELLDPAHKEALEVIMRERSGGKFEAITKVVMGAHLNMSSMAMTSFFGDPMASPTTSKPAVSSEPSSPSNIQQASTAAQQQDQQEGVLKRMMRTNFWRNDNAS
ncbi:lisH domain and HEAT repeat-containing protein KIAA1468 homolog [Selaginella moellendorffii]|uniref:lisH domain and HEAT repeat-containing protein KIAA1468 homolog n=1 Tax=Selaginella moellendorffii TaxID=88036 RepID=UPI000D1C2637|nr:lisH domain and HEAT repeat-containing protein KIAA1468 homolog [Selaginella moellendorffii]|eukprot:XP_024525022.1 lisH domain and HEAT repeat-containing protein KIAA1468 homolog [Selaginella moellendorffii]